MSLARPEEQEAFPKTATSTSMCASLRPSLAFEIFGKASCSSDLRICCSKLAFNPKNILHVIQASSLTLEPQRSPHGAFGKGHPATGLVGNFDALTFGGKQDSVVAHHVASTDGFKTDLLARALTGEAFAVVDSTFFYITAQSIGDDFAHTQ